MTVPRLLIFLLWLIIVVTNYQPGTWLIGWDNLLPEINIFLNLHKAIFAAWQSWQGLGIVGGIGHASELSRQLLLIPFSVFFPGHTVRYIWTFGMLLFGALGTYQLGLWLYQHSAQKRWIALIPAIFYIFNLATVQNFFVPLEAFSTFWGFIPWFLLSTFELIKNPSKKNMLIFALLQFWGASAFHVQTMFIVFSLLLGLYSILVFIYSKGSKTLTLVSMWLVLLVVHAYWLAPVGYFTLTNATQTVDSKQNTISTQEVYEANRAAGNISSILQLKGYWFGYTDVDNNATTYLFSAWKEHTESMPALLAGITVSILGLGGLLLLLKNEKLKENAETVFFLVATLLSISMLSAGRGIPGLGYVLITKLPLLGQIFRVPFTKWSVVFSLLIAIGLGYFMMYIIDKRKKIVAFLAPVIIVSLSVFSVLPVFHGEFLYKNVQLDLPKDYTALFSELKNYSASERILYLPFDDLWGWMNHDWGYRGSGFIWYGIEQPIIDRNFDVWSVRNETLYTQLQYAFQNNDVSKVDELLDKYDISLLLVDTSLSAPQQRVAETQTMLTQLTDKEVVSQTWKSDFLTLYKTNRSNAELEISPRKSVLPTEQKTIVDTLFSAESYISDPQSTIEYPFQNVLKESLIDSSLVVQKNQILVPLDKKKIVIPPLTTMKHMYGIQVIGNKITIEPLAPIEILNVENQKKRTLYQTQPFTITFDNLEEELYLDLDGRILNLHETEYTQVILDKNITQPIVIRISNKSDISQRDEATLLSSSYQEFTITNQTWSNLLTEKVETLSENEVVALLTVTEPISFLTDTASIENCDALQRGKTTKTTNDDASITYVSEDFGIYCDGKSTALTQSNHDHFLTIHATNSSGLPLRFYVKNNATNTVLTEHSLSQTENTFFVPPDVDSGTISVNFQNKSTGTASRNTLLSVSLHEIPVPLTTLAKILTTNDQNITSSTQLEKPTAETNLTVESFKTKKIGNFFYHSSFFIKNDPNSKENDLFPLIISLSQSYDEGWIAFTPSSFPTALPHYQTDGWKNGWIISKGKTNMYILYWPQLTIFAGYAVLAILFIILYKGVAKEKIAEKQKNTHAKSTYRTPKRVLAGVHKRGSK